MGQLGSGVMIAQLGGNAQSVETFRKGVGQVITRLELKDDALHFEFANGARFSLVDTGQSCCESRYMRTDDKLEDYIGAELVTAEISAGPDSEDEYGEPHETAFLKVQTSKGAFTMVSHNEHNGYYGGFNIEAVPA